MTAELARAVALGVRAAMARGMRVLAPQDGKWVNNNLWGDQRFQTLPLTEGAEISISPKLARMYGPPAVHSVQLSRSDDVQPQNADVYARIQYGCGAVNNSFDCDWLHGQQFSLVCNSVEVRAVTYRPIASQPYSVDDGAVALVAMVAKGAINQGRCPLTFTEPRGELTVSGGATPTIAYPVRDFVKQFTVHLAGTVGSTNSDPSVPTGIYAQIYTQGGGQLALYDLQVCAGGTAAIQLPSGASHVALVNSNGAGGTKHATLQWFLGL